MNSITRTAFISLSGVLLCSGTVLAGESVTVGPFGQGNAVTYSKPAPAPRTTIGLYRNGQGLGTPSVEPREQANWHTVGGFGNGGPVSFFAETR